LANGDIPPGGMVKVTIETINENEVTKTTLIEIPCKHVKPDDVATKVDTAVEHVKKHYEHQG
jgi:hypothetical protein